MPLLRPPRLPSTRVCPMHSPPGQRAPIRGHACAAGSALTPPALRGCGAHLKQVVSSPVGFRQGYRVVAILFSEQTSLQGEESDY